MAGNGGNFFARLVMIKSESRILIGANDVERLDRRRFGDGDDVENVMGKDGTHDVESVKNLTRLARFVSA